MGISQSTVSDTIWSVCNHIIRKANDWIHFPSNEQEFDDAKKMWRTRSKFPCAIGALDCTLIRIKKPKIHGDEYVCRKGYPALNVQATCDANSMFTSVDSSWTGSVHDSRIWRNSVIQQTLYANRRGALLLADEGYALTPWMMTVFRNPVTDAQKSYNKLHKIERSIIERMFGQVKQRFPILQNKMRMATERVPSMIVACFILHNVAKFLNDPEFEEEQPIHQDEGNVEHFADNNLYRRGEARRNQIATTIAGLDNFDEI